MKKYLIKGTNLEEVLKKAAKHLKVTVDDLESEVVQEDKNVFGKVKHVSVKVWEKNIKFSEKIEDDFYLADEKENLKIDKKVQSDGYEKDLIPNIYESAEIKKTKSGIYFKIPKEYCVNEDDQLEVYALLAKAEIKDVEAASVQRCFEDSKGEFVKIADYDPSYYVDAKVELKIVEGEMKVDVFVTEPERGFDIEDKDIFLKLQEAGILYGVDEESIREIIEKKLYNQYVTVAVGKEPIKGKDAEIIKFFGEDEKSKNPEIDGRGNADFKNITKIANTKIGSPLAKKEPLTKGIEGVNVFGSKIIPEVGLDKKIPMGKNVEISKDKLKLFSKLDGQISVVNGFINVFPIYVIDGDVDYSTGNIDFVGTVQVRGKVLEGFSIKAVGDIVVDGIVENAFLEAGGNIYVAKGVLGKENGDGYLKAGGDIKALFIQNMKIESTGSVEVLEHIMHSFIEADDTIKAIGGKGRIIGGHLISSKLVVANQMGSEYGNHTVVEIGISPNDVKEKKELIDELEETKESYENLKKEIITLQRMKVNGKTDDDKNRQLLLKTKHQFVLAKELKSIEMRLERLTRMEEKSVSGNVHVLNKVYEGVRLRIGSHNLDIKNELEHVTFYFNKSRKNVEMIPCEYKK